MLPRLPADAHPGAVRVQVRDLGQSVHYYEHVIGLRVLSRHPGSASLGPRGVGPPLVHLTARHDARPVPRGGSLGLFHFAILLPARAALGSFLAHAAALGQPSGLTGMSDHAVSEAIYLSDPDGLGIEVYADRPRDTWMHDARGQLHMTTMALDAQGLIASGKDEPWAGMPAGTRMGHVHLHVGDLARAEAFYHAALGFDKTVWEFPGALFLSAGGYHHHLGANTWSRGGPASEDQARLLWWELVVPDPDQAAEAARRLVSAGHDVVHEDDYWIASDPWGTRMKLVSPTARAGV
jgi:catechol 2,3-dioxygenase